MKNRDSLEGLLLIALLGLMFGLLCAFSSCAPAKQDTPSGGSTAGATGAQGPQGKPGASVGTIQFCAGQVQSYPTSFPEYGLCIGNELYAVYWDTHNAFLAKITAGTYQATSTGLQCTFTVASNCVVIN